MERKQSFERDEEDEEEGKAEKIGKRSVKARVENIASDGSNRT